MRDINSHVDVASMIAQKHALNLERKGLKRRGRSMYAIVKEQYGLKGNRESVYTQFCELVEYYKNACID